MKISKVLLRNYKSFNFDYKTKERTPEKQFGSARRVWDLEFEYEYWRPWIEVSIAYPIACIVGANESGKSHLINAVRKVIDREEKVSQDTCRFSDDYVKMPDDLTLLGLELRELGEAESVFVELPNWKVIAPFDGASSNENVAEGEIVESEEVSVSEADLIAAVHESVLLISQNSREFRVFANGKNGENYCVDLSESEANSIFSRLPKVHEVKSDIQLISECSLKDLLCVALNEFLKESFNLEETKSSAEYTKDQQFYTQRFGIGDYNQFKIHLSSIEGIYDDVRLVFRLLKHAGGYDYSRIKNLVGLPPAMRMAWGEKITTKIEKYLRISHWWSQDVDVKIQFGVESDKIVIATTDRTDTYYDISERSRGFRSFLGYILQLFFVRSEVSGPALILSDEPDFALSAVGQRNLLRFFREIVADGDQLIYSTHSMELIDPNYPNRTTIIRKGQYEEGTLPVRKQYHNYFEPIRSALGTRITAVPFIEGPNLLVEGASDLRFIVRMSQYLAENGRHHIDLAELSIVVAGGCSKMGNVVEQAISVMGDRAYITVILDNDPNGRETREMLEEKDGSLKERKQIIMVNDLHDSGVNKDTEIEDLIPPGLYFEAFRQHLLSCNLDSYEAKLPEKSDFESKAATVPMVDCVTEIVDEWGIDENEYELDKTQLIENVFDLLIADDNAGADWKDEFVQSIEKISKIIDGKIQMNVRRMRHEKVSKAIRYLIDAHKRTFPEEAPKSDAKTLVSRIASVAKELPHMEIFDERITKIREDHQLNIGDSDDLVPDYPKMLDKLHGVRATLNLD